MQRQRLQPPGGGAKRTGTQMYGTGNNGKRVRRVRHVFRFQERTYLTRGGGSSTKAVQTMARKKKPAHLKRTKEIRIYLTPDQKRLIKGAVGRQEISEWAREVLLAAAVSGSA